MLALDGRFGGVPIEDAAGWTWEWQENNVVAVAGNTPTYIAETVSESASKVVIPGILTILFIS